MTGFQAFLIILYVTALFIPTLTSMRLVYLESKKIPESEKKISPYLLPTLLSLSEKKWITANLNLCGKHGWVKQDETSNTER